MDALSLQLPNAVYRTDPMGESIIVLPATCPRGEHSFQQVGCQTRTAGDDLLRVTCGACGDEWTLRLTHGMPKRAELDDEPYPPAS
ncbi:hypothetical protein ACFQ1S_21315 [Kibdelosporangium lantanae]|uniref:Uncharacterized protein n=1 Tax=Kibdelosporangium lantanae TaxID=1497396 RepID=A0ABW3MAT9_9PSEU